jgi:hypothetical protein
MFYNKINSGEKLYCQMCLKEQANFVMREKTAFMYFITFTCANLLINHYLEAIRVVLNGVLDAIFRPKFELQHRIHQ